jgi:CDGSH iron-sulfur domain-containing protein 3
MSEPKIAKKGPYAVEVKAGETYYWCTCGQSEAQPFCNGAHKGSGFMPQAFTAEADDALYFCGCKHTATQPLCDGAHNRLPDA